jgi:uncharacterized membrane protein (DUF373 family)
MNFFGKIERVIASALLVLMGIVVASATVEVGYEVVMGLINPPGFFLGVSELLGIFGLFLIVLIGLELMTSIHMYLEDNTIHAEMMFLVAMTAVTRKIVIMDTSKMDPMLIFGLGFLIISLAAGYYLIRKRRLDADPRPASE